MYSGIYKRQVLRILTMKILTICYCIVCVQQHDFRSMAKSIRSLKRSWLWLGSTPRRDYYYFNNI